ARGHQRDAGAPRGASIAVGGMDCGLLMAHEDVLDLCLLEELVVDVQYGTARVAENVVHALLLQASHHDLCATDFHCTFRKKAERETLQGGDSRVKTKARTRAPWRVLGPFANIRRANP